MAKKLPKSFLENSDFYFIKDKYPGIISDINDPEPFLVEHRKPHTSWKLTDWVMRHSNLKGTNKLVSAQIASLYNKDEGYSYPTYEQIMQLTGISYSSVSRAIKAMKLSGEWIVINTSQELYSRHTNNRYYYLSPTKLDEYLTLEEINAAKQRYKTKMKNLDSVPTKEFIEDYPKIWTPRLSFSSLKLYNFFIEKNLERTDWYKL